MEFQKCPSCGADVPPDARGGLRCAGCGVVLAEPFALCPRCGHVNPAGTPACARCDAELTAACPGCGRINWSGAERCGDCGREMDLLAHAFRPVSASFELRRQELQQRVSSLKGKAEQESQARLEMLREADRRRMQRAAEAAVNAQRRQQRIIRMAGAAIGLFILLLILALVLSAGIAGVPNG